MNIPMNQNGGNTHPQRQSQRARVFGSVRFSTAYTGSGSSMFGSAPNASAGVGGALPVSRVSDEYVWTEVLERCDAQLGAGDGRRSCSGGSTTSTCGRDWNAGASDGRDGRLLFWKCRSRIGECGGE